MKQFTGKKSGSAAVFVAVTAVALIGFSALVIGSGRLDSYLHKRKLRSTDKTAASGNQSRAISTENAALRHNVELLSASLDKLVLQNEKLLAANNALSRALEEEHERVMKLMSVVTEENEEKLVLTRNLEEANSKLSMSEDVKAKVHIA